MQRADEEQRNGRLENQRRRVCRSLVQYVRMNGNTNDRGEKENRDEEKTHIREAQRRFSFVSRKRAAPERGPR